MGWQERGVVDGDARYSISTFVYATTKHHETLPRGALYQFLNTTRAKLAPGISHMQAANITHLF